MPRHLRGCVVSRGGLFGVVWADRGLMLDLLPIIAPADHRMGDVLLELSDLIACAAPIAHAVIRPALLSVRAEGQVEVGTVPGPTMCRVVQSLIRAANEAAYLERWAGDRQHSRNAATRPVKLVGP